MTPILWRITAALALVCALIAAVLIYGQKQYRAGHTAATAEISAELAKAATEQAATVLQKEREAAAQFAAAQAVSTHSRAKAAGDGWACIFGSKGFQLTAARRRLGIGRGFFNRNKHKVSTHSRAKAAGFTAPSVLPLHSVSTHSRAKAAGSQKSAKA